MEINNIQTQEKMQDVKQAERVKELEKTKTTNTENKSKIDEQDLRRRFDSYEENQNVNDVEKPYSQSIIMKEEAVDTDISEEDEATADTSDDVDTNKLYTYTDSELKDLMLNNKISRSEYNQEVGKRELKNGNYVSAED